jgi:hypothetical protein
MCSCVVEEAAAENRLPEHALVLYTPMFEAPPPVVLLNDAESFVTLLRHLDVSTVFVTQHGASVFLVHDGTSYAFIQSQEKFRGFHHKFSISSIDPRTSPKEAANFLLLAPPTVPLLPFWKNLSSYQTRLRIPVSLEPTPYHEALSWIVGCLAEACGDRDALREGFASVRGLWTNHNKQCIYGLLPADAVLEAFAMSREEHERLWEFTLDPDFTTTLMRVLFGD